MNAMNIRVHDMEYGFFLSEKYLPAGFKYPDAYVKFAAGELPNLEPWQYFYGHSDSRFKGLSQLEFRFQGLKKRYPDRLLVPFARRGDGDDVACFDASTPSDNPRVLIIHDWASPGWENRGECKDFLDWVKFAKNVAVELKKYLIIRHKKMEHLSKTISYALRHAPWEYELELDDEGWVSIPALISALKAESDEFRDLIESDLDWMMVESTKERFEIKAHKIRALYGHSTPDKLIKTPLTPPAILYHGTSPTVAEIILTEGLKPMNRHYVHLSIDVATAKQVALRKSKTPVILKIDANQAHQHGIKFYKGSAHVWLADFIAAEYIKIFDICKR